MHKFILFLTTIISLNTYAQKETRLYVDQNEKPPTTTIGSQTWTTSNLDVDRFRNGDKILEVTSGEQWKKAWDDGTPAWCYYEYKEENGLKYGRLYNWHAVTDPRGLAPEGWHIPKITEWDTLTNYLGSDMVFTKVVDGKGWIKGLSKTSNESGLSIFAGGSGDANGFGGIGVETYLWASPKDPKAYSNALIVMVSIYSAPGINKAYGMEKMGMYVRCVKD